MRLLKSAVTVDDYVVVKVDIEGGPELNIVESIAHIPELSELVDELYFEYPGFTLHVNDFVHWV